MKDVDHAKLIAVKMLSYAGPEIGKEEFPKLYAMALQWYQNMIGRVGDEFDPPDGFREAVCETLIRLLPTRTVWRKKEGMS